MCRHGARFCNYITHKIGNRTRTHTHTQAAKYLSLLRFINKKVIEGLMIAENII